MHFDLKALAVFIGFVMLLTIAQSSHGGAWFHIGEAVSTLIIAAGITGWLRGGRARAR